MAFRGQSERQEESSEPDQNEEFHSADWTESDYNADRSNESLITGSTMVYTRLTDANQ